MQLFGFETRRGRGSHVLFKHVASGARLTVPDPGHGTVKPAYVRKAIMLMDEHNG